MLRLFARLALYSLLSIAGVYANPQTGHCDDVREQLALDVARVAVNEAGFGSPRDVLLIWQVVEANGRTDADRLAWLRRHSACPTAQTTREVALSRPGNCRWTRELDASDRRPESWPADVVWRAESWARVRRLALRLVFGLERRRVCSVAPMTWGGPMDHERALERGLVPVECEGTLNRGYRVVTYRSSSGKNVTRLGSFRRISASAFCSTSDSSTRSTDLPSTPCW